MTARISLTQRRTGAHRAPLQRRLLRMIGIRVEVCVQKFAARGPGTSAWRFDRHKNRVDLRQNARVFELEHPAVLILIVDIEDSEALGWILSWSTRSPNLERCISFRSVPIAQVKSVKDQGLLLRIKDTAKCPLVLAFAVDVEHVSNMKITRAHQVMDVAAGRQ